MTTVIKAKKPKRIASVSSILTQSFAKHRKSSNGRMVQIACTPQSFSQHGDNWYALAKSQISKVAKSRGLTIASWDEKTKAGVPVLDVYFDKALAAFYQDFQSDLYHDLIDPEYKGNFDVVSVVCKGDENRGTLLIEIDVSKHTYATSRQELRRVLDSLFADTYHKRVLGIGNVKNEKQDHRTLSITYRDVPFND